MRVHSRDYYTEDKSDFSPGEGYILGIITQEMKSDFSPGGLINIRDYNKGDKVISHQVEGYTSEIITHKM